MSESTAQIRRTLTSRNERKELLVLACEVDGVAWHQACKPTRGPGLQFTLRMLRHVQTFGSLVPGRLGRSRSRSD